MYHQTRTLAARYMLHFFGRRLTVGVLWQCFNAAILIGYFLYRLGNSIAHLFAHFLPVNMTAGWPCLAAVLPALHGLKQCLVMV